MNIERGSADGFLEDAAHYPGGHAEGVVFPRTTSEIAEALARARTALVIGAQSSLTGGATPMGELIIATSKMTRVLDRTANRITVEVGLTVAAMQELLSTTGAWFPPAPTFTGACAGGSWRPTRPAPPRSSTAAPATGSTAWSSCLRMARNSP